MELTHFHISSGSKWRGGKGAQRENYMEGEIQIWNEKTGGVGTRGKITGMNGGRKIWRKWITFWVFFYSVKNTIFLFSFLRWRCSSWGIICRSHFIKREHDDDDDHVERREKMKRGERKSERISKEEEQTVSEGNRQKKRNGRELFAIFPLFYSCLSSLSFSSRLLILWIIWRHQTIL